MCIPVTGKGDNRQRANTLLVQLFTIEEIKQIYMNKVSFNCILCIDAITQMYHLNIFLGIESLITYTY
jgi:hypothetical protein